MTTEKRRREIRNPTARGGGGSGQRMTSKTLPTTNDEDEVPGLMPTAVYTYLVEGAVGAVGDAHVANGLAVL
jgi:hypothetical protein